MVNLWIIFQLYALSILIGTVSGLPGGIGSREISFAFLLVTYAMVTKDQAGIIALLVIATDLMIESCMAIVGGIWYLVRNPR